MYYQNQQRKKFKIKFQVLLKFAQILPDYHVEICSIFCTKFVLCMGYPFMKLKGYVTVLILSESHMEVFSV